MNNEKKFIKLTPFKMQVLQSFPFIDEDFDAITNYELLCKVVEYLNKTVDNVDLLNEKIEEFQHYFDNLDVQEEINNKLDEMAESGELINLIKDYVDPIYKAYEDEINNTVSGLSNRVNLLDTKKYIIIGDSYCEGYTPDGNVTGWGTRIKNWLGLTDSNCTITYHGGASFSNPDNNFITLLNAISNDSTVTDIIVGGGYNDAIDSYTYDSLFNGIVDFKTACSTKFPNAKVHVFFIGNTSNPAKKDIINKTYVRYKDICNQYKIAFYENVVFTLHDYSLFSSDGYHPNNNGNQFIARNIMQCLATGTCSVRNRDIPLTITYPSGFGTSGLQFSTSLNNDQMYVGIHSNYHIRPNSVDMTFDGNTFYELGTIASGNITGAGSSNYYNAMECNVIMQDGSNKFYNVPVKFLIQNRKLMLNGYVVNDAGNSYLSLTGVKDIQIGVNSWLLDTWKC